MTQFEVGKQYRYLGGRVEDCIAVVGNEAWIKSPNGGNSFVTMPHEGWKEHKEPRKASAWTNVYEDDKGNLRVSGNTHSTREAALKMRMGPVFDTIEITYTEKV